MSFQLLRARINGWVGRGLVIGTPVVPPTAQVWSIAPRVWGKSDYTVAAPPSGFDQYGFPANTRDSTFIIGTTKPDATNTGLFGSPTLTLDTGVGNVRTYSDSTSAIKLIQNMRFRCRLNITGKHYRFYNCELEGNPFGGLETANTNAATAEDIIFKDCKISPVTTWSNTSAFKGWNTTIIRCDIEHVIDGFAQQRAQGGWTPADTPQNTKIWGCYYHDLSLNAPDAGAAGGVGDNQGHVDAVLQMRGGNGNEVVGCNIQGFCTPDIGIGSAGQPSLAAGTWHIQGDKHADEAVNPNPVARLVAISALMYSPYLGDTGSLLFDRNWVDGTAVVINLNPGMSTAAPGAIKITNNRLGPIGQRSRTADRPLFILAHTALPITLTGNTKSDGAAWNVRDRGN